VAHDEPSQSRYVTVTDIPRPTDPKGTFVYNFFTPDERTNATGNSKHPYGTVRTIKQDGKTYYKVRSSQKQIASTVVDLQLPRYNLIEFVGHQVSQEASFAGANDSVFQDVDSYLSPQNIHDFKQNLNSEETLSTVRDISYGMTDFYVRSRLYDRASLLARILNTSVDDPAAATTAIVNEYPNLNKDDLRDVITPRMIPGVSYVNETGRALKPPIFTLASGYEVSSFGDRRLIEQDFSGNYTRESITKRLNGTKALNDAMEYLPNATTDGAGDGFTPTFFYINPNWADGPNPRCPCITLGYVINRKLLSELGDMLESQDFYLPGADNTTYIDTKILYGVTYAYSIRTIVLVKMTVPGVAGDDILIHPYNTIEVPLVSSPSKVVTITTQENIAPLEPDGIFYEYNFDGGGLRIRWQTPVGRQRDTKFYQVFRRKTINEPFECIVELDFDNSEIKSTRSELVDSDSVVKVDSPQLFYIDKDFDRRSSYIYAVCAIDAHGLTSGYSVQTRVIFDRHQNNVDLQYISMAGAPKQYPNFFVDPDLDDNIFVDSLSQDAMMTSNKHKMRIYFDPDAISYSKVQESPFTGEPIEEHVNIVSMNDLSEASTAWYKLNLINLDRQKTTSLQLNITDLGEAS